VPCLAPPPQALVLKALVGLCTVLYKGLPTSIQQDAAALGGLAPGSRMALAVGFRLAGKRTLEGATRRLLQRLAEVQGQQGAGAGKR
jgi:ABC-type nitrate/sulfonate/bicarbonate transport system permease component